MEIICVNCGEIMGTNECEGSLKHPYCKKCFKEIWNDDYKKFLNFLRNEHNH